MDIKDKLVSGKIVPDDNGGYFYKNGSDYDYRHFYWTDINKGYWEEERYYI